METNYCPACNQPLPKNHRKYAICISCFKSLEDGYRWQRCRRCLDRQKTYSKRWVEKKLAQNRLPEEVIS